MINNKSTNEKSMIMHEFCIFYFSFFWLLFWFFLLVFFLEDLLYLVSSSGKLTKNINALKSTDIVWPIVCGYAY